MRLFISYSLRDNYLTYERLEHVDLVVSKLGKAFIDALHNHSNNHQKRVYDEIRMASIVIFLVTPGCIESKWVNWERQKTKEYKKRFVEVFINEKKSWAFNLRKIEKIVSSINLGNQSKCLIRL